MYKLENRERALENGKKAYIFLKNIVTQKPLRRYKIFGETLYHPDLGEYATYGIEYNDGSRCARINDISTQRAAVQSMSHMFNNMQLDCTHFYDAVNDMLPKVI
ncbi:MAG: hypothetical protein LBS74_06565 [Oscillospiraceae bacterium]|jgi:hypothetical protein|nr:hypothetical protein [Oscillospiraceae bacterium]